MNNDLISRSALIADISAIYGGNEDNTVIWYGDVLRFIGEQPSVDAAEAVRCGYCKDGKSFIGQTIMIANDGKCHTIRFCPNCGAKMDGERKGDDGNEA